MSNNKLDRELIEEILSGKDHTFKVLYDRYKHSLFVLCLRYTKDRSTAEDYLQETFVKIYSKLKQYDPEKGLFEFWARRIAINVCLEDIRKNSLYTVSLSVVEHEEADQVDVLSHLSTKEMLELIQNMPVGYKTVFNLYVIDGFSHKEIAERLEIAIGTSKSQLLKARKYLQGMIAKKNDVYNASHG
ncbi:MAG: sigma-70 family RNA polymerase sigma factor [Saprospirales bacterium]|nr:MAG: sigma-70 family RNA polymerase sigma factor [Saprospirales bacterium]